MKTFVALALTLVLTAANLVGCGCTNQNMDNTSAPTVLPTNEEIWNSTETTTHSTTEGSMTTETTNGGGTNGGSNGGTTTESTDETRGVNETEVQNHVNAHTEMMDKIREKNNATPSEGNGGNNARQMMPGSR